MVEFVVVTTREERHEFATEEKAKEFLADLDFHRFDDVTLIKIDERMGVELDEA